MRMTVAFMLVALLMEFAFADPRISRGTSASGVIAYQDHDDDSQFHYLPAMVDLTLGNQLSDYKAVYWGIGSPHYVQESSGEIRSYSGAVVSGRAVIDISRSQREAIIEEIRSSFGIEEPRLLPLRLSNVEVQPTWASGTLSLGSRADVVFPSSVQLGTTFNFAIGTGNSLFAETVATLDESFIPEANGLFGINVVGEVEFVGDPWEVEVKCDLAQVWKQVRQKFSASGNYYWFSIGNASYESIHQELDRSGACTYKEVEGSLDTAEYGREIFEMTRRILEAINTAGREGEGFFRFEPNPQAAPVSSGGGGGSSIWPWSVNINGGYSSAYFQQSITWQETVSYQGRFKVKQPASMSLAVQCNYSTGHLFSDLDDPYEPCITRSKSRRLRDRLACERTAQVDEKQRLAGRLESGRISLEVYDLLFERVNRTSFCEDQSLRSAPGAFGVSRDDISMRALESNPWLQPGSEDLLSAAVNYRALSNSAERLIRIGRLELD